MVQQRQNQKYIRRIEPGTIQAQIWLVLAKVSWILSASPTRHGRLSMFLFPITIIRKTTFFIKILMTIFTTYF